MKTGNMEMQAYLLFEEHIRKLCRGRWGFLEMEDRISEAALLFIAALRIFPTNSGRFWEDYLWLLERHMDRLRREYGRQKCWLSLDAPLGIGTGLDRLMAREIDDTYWPVEKFLRSMPLAERKILEMRMDGRSEKSVSMGMKIPVRKIRGLMSDIAEDYADFCLGKRA